MSHIVPVSPQQESSSMPLSPTNPFSFGIFWHCHCIYTPMFHTPRGGKFTKCSGYSGHMWTPISVHIWVPSRLQRIMPITLNLARCRKHRYCFSMETLGWLQLGVSLRGASGTEKKLTMGIAWQTTQRKPESLAQKHVWVVF